MIGHSPVVDVAEGYVAAILFGADDSLENFLGADAVVEDLQAGHIHGAQSLREFSNKLRRCMDPYLPRLRHLRTTTMNRRACSEDIMLIDVDGEEMEIPVATVVSTGDAPEGIVVHAYHNIRPFEYRSPGRPSPERKMLFSGYRMRLSSTDPTDVIGRFIEAIRSNDLDAAMACAEADVYLRESDVALATHFGPVEVRARLAALLSDGTSMLWPEAITDDGRCAAIEFSITGRDAGSSRESRRDPGLLVVERSEDQRVRALRIYADVGLPLTF